MTKEQYQAQLADVYKRDLEKGTITKIYKYDDYKPWFLIAYQKAKEEGKILPE